ncbi:MAG: hypothetical protein JWQ88_1788 [Rhodoferax sp.]|nr:hypothetical protein [Rhodoferax sp.]
MLNDKASRASVLALTDLSTFNASDTLKHLSENHMGNTQISVSASRPDHPFRGKVNEVIGAFTKKNIEAILCHEEERRKRESALHRAVQRIAGFCGSLTFLWIQIAWFAAWIAWNVEFKSFDPYPFQFLMLVVSLEAIFLSVLILISQNFSASESERRHHLDLQMNLLTERETTAILRLLSKMADKMEVSAEDQAEVDGFSDNTDPSAVLQQIIKAERKHGSKE